MKQDKEAQPNIKPVLLKESLNRHRHY